MEPTRLDFALRFVDGKGVLGLGDKMRIQLVEIDRFELRVPNLRFPFDVSGGVARFQSRRCDFGAADLSVDGAGLQAWLDGRTRLSRLGISQLRARLAKGRIELSARARVGDSQASLTARVTLEPAGGQRLVARIADVRLYGFLPAPAPLIGLGIAVGLGAEPDGKSHALAVRGTGELSLNPLELLLWRALPPAGWRLPRYRHAALDRGDRRRARDRVALRRRRGGVAEQSGGGERARRRAARGRSALGARRSARRRRGVRRAGQGRRRRRGRARAAAGGAGGAAGALARGGDDWRAAGRDASRAGAGVVRARRHRGRARAARRRRRRATCKLAELAEAAGERDDARLASLRAGELFMRVSPKEAIPWLERTLATGAQRRAGGDASVRRLRRRRTLAGSVEASSAGG